MSHPDELRDDGSGGPQDDLDRALTTTADVESAGRSCVVIIALVVVILALLAAWVIYTAT
jgi:hypothetical protein